MVFTHLYVNVSFENVFLHYSLVSHVASLVGDLHARYKVTSPARSFSVSLCSDAFWLKIPLVACGKVTIKHVTNDKESFVDLVWDPSQNRLWLTGVQQLARKSGVELGCK